MEVIIMQLGKRLKTWFVLGAGLLSTTSVLANDTRIIRLDGLPSGESSQGLGLVGCPISKVEADGIPLSKKADGVFVSTARDGIDAKAKIEVEVPESCNAVGLSELKVDQLSQGDDELLPEQDELPAAPAKAARSNGNRGTRTAARPAPGQRKAPQEGEPEETQPAAEKGKVLVQLPGRVLESSLNHHFNLQKLNTGHIQRRTRVQDNVGGSVTLRQYGGSTTTRHIEIEDTDMRIPGKGSNGGGGTHALAGHSWLESGNTEYNGDKVDSEHTTTDTVISGNIGTDVSIEQDDRHIENTTFIKKNPKPAPIHNHYTTNNTTQVVEQRYYVPRVYWDGYRRCYVQY